MKNTKQRLKNITITIVILAIFFVISLLIEKVLNTHSLISAVFTLAVFLISLFVQGYIYGILASLLSVLAVNYAFTFPYFKFNFSITENLVSAVIMLIITIMTSALTTKLKQQEKIKAENEKEKMKSNLLRAISHDLRSPLTTIYGSSSVMLENIHNLSEEQILQLSGGIREDAQWLIRMVENLLSITRIDNSGVKLIKTPVVLEELIDSVLIKFKKRYEQQWVEVNIPEEFISIPMDSVLIEQVILNLLENAVQHATGMTELKLSVYIERKKAIFEVSDNGCGIQKERIDKIFSGYYEKKDNIPADNKKHSMGIGLSVCASIINAHGSSISARNNEQGGCSFSFPLDIEV